MEENLERLKREFPELGPEVLQAALDNHEDNYFRASEAIKAKYYNDTAGISIETPFWAPILASLVGSDRPRNGDGAGAGTSTSAADDWLAPLHDGIAQVGEGLLQVAQAVVDVLPELNFWDDGDEGHEMQGKPRSDRDEVVTASGAQAGANAKRRGSVAARGGGGDGSVRSRSEEEEASFEAAGKED